MAKVKFGIIGCGKIADCNHVPEILSLGDKAEIVAMYDKKPGKAKELADKHNLSPKICRSMAEILATDVDAVVIATPNCFHMPQTLEALKAGKHVLVEKPMASSVADADKMIDTAKKCGKVLHVNQSLRFAPLYVEIKKMIDNGEIGAPMHARCLRASANSPDIAWSPGATWFVKKRYEGSLVGDIAIHMADVLQWYFGPVKQISAVTRCREHEVVDNVAAVFDFANGATASLELSWTFPISTGALELYGDKGVIRMSSDGAGIELLNTEGKVVKTVKGADLPAIPNSHAAFVTAIEQGLDSWMVGRSALALCMAINESNQTGMPAKPKNRRKK